jgi:anti-sigma regulatory factor (Ser/Thr protein kinase)
MIAVDQIGQIRRAYFEQGVTIKQIVRDQGVSRDAACRALRCDRV